MIRHYSESRIFKYTAWCLCFILLGPGAIVSQEKDVRNIDVVFERDAVVVYYDLYFFAENARYDVELMVSVDGGKLFSLTPRFVSGDIGRDIPAGSRKRIIWYPERDYIDEIGPERYTVSVSAVRRERGKGLLYVLIGAAITGGGAAAYFLLGGKDDGDSFPKPPERPTNN